MTARTVSAWLAALWLTAAHPAAAQTPLVELTGGYQLTRVPDKALPVGWAVDAAVNLDASWGLLATVSGAYATEQDGDLGTAVHLSLHTFGAGARWSRRAATSIVPFLHLLVGAGRVSARAKILDTSFGDSSTDFMLQPGGGVSFRLSDRSGLVGQMDYRRIFLDEEEDVMSGRNEIRLFVGLRIGR
jgi:hypothetical protein